MSSMTWFLLSILFVLSAVAIALFLLKSAVLAVGILVLAGAVFIGVLALSQRARKTPGDGQ